VRVGRERDHTPIGDDDADELDGDRDWFAVACAPSIVEADGSTAFVAVGFFKNGAIRSLCDPVAEVRHDLDADGWEFAKKSSQREAVVTI
jgi:hypothetical protein